MKFFNLNQDFIYYLNIVIWIGLISGINVNIDHYILNENPSIANILYFLRLYFQYFIFFILIFFNLYFYKKIEINFIFIIFLILNIVQALSLLYSENSNLNLIFNIQTLNILLFLNLFSYFFPKKLFDLLFVLLFFLLIIFIYFYFENFYFFFKESFLFYGHYNPDPFIKIIDNPPRSSGMARIALIFFIFSLFFIDYVNNKKKTIYIILLFSVAVYMFQSRTILFIYFFVIFLLSFAHKFQLNNLTQKNFRYNFFYFILIPFLIFLFISNIQPKNFNQLLKKFDLNIISVEDDSRLNLDYKILRKNNPKSFSSGRYKDWSDIIQKNNRYFFGNGTLGDRFLINQTASNIILYLFASCGFVGIILFLFLIYRIFNMLLINKAYLQNINSNNKKVIFSIYITLIFLLRSILENSFIVYGIDQVIQNLGQKNLANKNDLKTLIIKYLL